MKRSKVLNGLFGIVLGRTGLYKYSWVRRAYWNLRARNIEHLWGRSRDDYDALRNIISSIPGVVRILDIGCGSGRLFPLYQSLEIKEVVAQDIARNALDLAEQRYGCQNIQLVNLPVEALDFAPAYFDLVISNRVLQHIAPANIEGAVRSICRLGKFVFVNELSATDGIPENAFMFKHDYLRLFGKFDFGLQDRGLLGKQTWMLFAKSAADGNTRV